MSLHTIRELIKSLCTKHDDFYECRVSANICHGKEGLFDYHGDIGGFASFLTTNNLTYDHFTWVHYRFFPKHSSDLSSTYYVMIDATEIHIYITAWYRGLGRRSLYDSEIQLIEDRGRSFKKYINDTRFWSSEGYPEQLKLYRKNSEAEEIIKQTFDSYNVTLFQRLQPRFNLHLAFDAGFLKIMSDDLKDMIMNKLDNGKLTYQSSLSLSCGLHALGF